MKQFVFDGERINRWVREKAGGDFGGGGVGVGVERDGELVVGVCYDGYTGSSIAIHSRCDDPKATSRRFYWMIFDYPFNQLGVKCVRGLVAANNFAARKVNEGLGFREEAVLADYFPDDNAIIYVMRREDCRFLALGERYANRVVAQAA